MSRPKAYIVGAGPGDPKLLTVAAKEILESAEVILHDRLVSSEILKLASASAEIINVGKHQGEQESVQLEISELLIKYLEQGKSVVRLKGGDPLIFGRGAEEWQFVKEQGYAVEFVPGISSSIAVPGLCGIPLTSRDFSRGFAVLTGHACGDGKIEWANYAKVDTLVILMAVRNRASIAQELIKAGRNPEEPVAFIENGSCENERIVLSQLRFVAEGEPEVNAPAVLVIGEVVNFCGKLL